jgi:hypothetical protein
MHREMHSLTLKNTNEQNQQFSNSLNIEVRLIFVFE